MTTRTLSTSDVAERLGISRQRALVILTEGRIPSTRTPSGRYQVEEAALQAYIRAGNQPRLTGPHAIAVANQKGGVGKSTTAVSLSAALVDHGQRVLLVDLDPQANATQMTGFDMAQDYRSVYNAMRDYVAGASARLEDVIVELEPDWSLVPSHISLARMELDLFAAVSKEYVLRDLLEPVRALFDWIVIDCPPALGMLTINALTAADEVLIPQIPDFISAQGIQELLNTIGVVRRRPNPGLRISGVLFTKVRAHTDHHRQMREQIAEFCRRNSMPLLSAPDEDNRESTHFVEINDTIEAADAAGQAKPLSRYKSYAGAGAAYQRLAAMLLEREAANA